MAGTNIGTGAVELIPQDVSRRSGGACRQRRSVGGPGSAATPNTPWWGVPVKSGSLVSLGSWVGHRRLR